MWPSEDKMPNFKELSYRDKLRVRKCLRRGEAPDDPGLAAAAVELAERYQRQGRGEAALYRWGALFLAVVYAVLAVWSAIDGEYPKWMFQAALTLGWAGLALVEPALRPKSIARSLEASRRIAAVGAP